MKKINRHSRYTGLRTCFVTLLSVFTIFSCHSKDMPKSENMLVFSYKENSMERYGKSYYVKRNNNYAIVILNKDTPFEKSFKSDTTIFNDLQLIIDKYKIYRYKNHYTCKHEIKDGTSWSIHIKYSDNPFEISSDGENAWPHNGRPAADEIKKYFITRFEDKK